MAAKVKITGETILQAAVELVRTGGPEALNARALAKALGCSTQPIFRNYSGMEALRAAVLEEAYRRYRDFRAPRIAASDAPAYKAAGMAYIAFARAEPQLFRLLYMRDRTDGREGPEKEDWSTSLVAVERYTGLDHSRAELFHLEMWAFVHGIAAMEATGYLDLDPETVSTMLTDAFLGIKQSWEDRYERH